MIGIPVVIFNARLHLRNDAITWLASQHLTRLRAFLSLRVKVLTIADDGFIAAKKSYALGSSPINTSIENIDVRHTSTPQLG